MKNLTLALLLALLMSPVQFSWATPPPIVEYQFNEGTGILALNSGSLGPGTNGSISGAAYSLDTPFRTGYSLQFDGVDDFVRVQDTFNYTNQLTIEAWIKPYAVNGQRIIWDDYGNPGVVFSVWNGRVQFSISTEKDPGLGIEIYTGNIITGEWQHVAGVYDGAQMRVYINGVQTGPVKDTSGTIIDNPDSGTGAAIGSSNVEYWLLNFKGNIDDFRIFNAALLPEELAGGHFFPVPEPVFIDIKPGTYPNSINPKSKGKIPVAILSTKDFNAPKMVDRDSLTFGATGDEDSLAFCNPKGEYINGDRLKDLVCHFYTEDTEFLCGDTEGVLKGMTTDGALIEGRDSVRIVPCKK